MWCNIYVRVRHSLLNGSGGGGYFGVQTEDSGTELKRSSTWLTATATAQIVHVHLIIATVEFPSIRVCSNPTI